jgi:type I restriction enzyme S subunit
MKASLRQEAFSYDSPLAVATNHICSNKFSKILTTYSGKRLAAMKAGWQTKNLGDLCRIRTGKKDVNEGNPDGEFPFFTCAAEHTFSDSYSFDTEALLIAGNGDVGKVSYYKGKFEAYQRTYVLSDFRDVLPRFLYLILDGKLKETVSKQKLGNTMPYIKMGMLTDFPVPVPPPPEQRRIVGILDEAFEDIATAKANAEKNHQNARALFESSLQSVFTERGPGWVEKPLGSVATFRNGINYTKDSRGESIKIVGVRSFQKNFSAPLDDLDTVTIDGELSELDTLKQDDILAVRSNGNIELIGRCMLVGEVADKVSHSGFTIRIRPAPGELHPNYLCYFMKSASSRKRLTEGGTGTNIKSLNQRMLSALTIPFPPVSAQKLIVEKLENLSEETQRLASLYEQKLAALEALKKSLLHQAFTGQL